MSAEIKQYISACEICRKFDTTSQPNESLMSHEVPSRPWERVGADIFTLHDKDYLETENGTVYRRNRQHLKKTSEPPIQSIQSDPVGGYSTPNPDVPSIPTLPAELVDKPLGSTSCESSTDQHQRPQHDRRPPVYLKDYVCS